MSVYTGWDAPGIGVYCLMAIIGRVIISFLFEARLLNDIEHRTLHRRELAPPGLFLHQPIMIDATRTLLLRLLDTPQQLFPHLRHMAGTIILSSAYGIDVLPSNDPYVAIAEKGLEALAVGGKPAGYLVDSMPILKHVPHWFQRCANEWRKSVEEMPEVTMGYVKRAMVRS
jgi:hypothetical protein